MTRTSRTSAAAWMVAILLVAALAALAVLQYRWAGELATADRAAMQKRLADSARRVADDFDREIASLVGDFQIPDERLEPALAAALERWRRTTDEPHLIASIYVATLGSGFVDLAQFDERTRQAVQVELPPQLLGLRSRFEFSADGRPGRMIAPTPVTLVGDDIFVVVPTSRADEGSPGDFMQRQPPRFVVLQLDGTAIRREILPRLVTREFGAEETRNYDVAIYSAGDREHAIVRLGNGARRVGDADVVQPMLRVGRGAEPFGRPPGPIPRFRFLRDPVLAPGAPPPGAWQLVATHRSGSLDSAVAETRRRNLLVSGAVLLLLATSIAFVVTASRRATVVARQQIDFVAAVTHELNTPITAIRNAGENLADGVVTSPEQVRSYGEMIKREGRRLSSSVESVLAFAGMRGEVRYRSDELAVSDVIGAAVAECRSLAAEKRATVELSLPDRLPPVRGDASALRQAFRNLVENAIKYGGDDPRVTIRAAEDAQRLHSVAVRVEDEGIGFADSEAGRLFEPFVRGSNALSNAIPGNGIGLSLVQKIVQAHGGTVGIAQRRGKKGSVVTVTLPVA